MATTMLGMKTNEDRLLGKMRADYDVYTAGRLAKETEVRASSIAPLLTRLSREGKVVKVGVGLYKAARYN